MRQSTNVLSGLRSYGKPTDFWMNRVFGVITVFVLNITGVRGETGYIELQTVNINLT